MSSRFQPYAFHEAAISQFYGGQSADEAIGTQASFSYSMALEHRRNPSQLTILPGARKISAAVVTDLITNMVQVQTGDRYAYGNTGKVYKVSTANVVTSVGNFPTGSDGMTYRSDNDALYFATQTDIRRYYPMSGNPAFDVTYGPSRSADVNAYRTAGAASYAVPVAINETQFISFKPDIEPFYSFKINVLAKGTGNVTVTLHDGLNNNLGAITIATASLTTGLNEFIFAAPIRALVKPNARTYHVHVTSTVADTTLVVGTAAALNTADFELWASRLVPTINQYHPMIQFQQFTCIGNGRYLAVWEPLTDSNPPNNEFQRHRITLPAGFEICGLAVTDEFLVIAAGKYSTNGTKDFQEGKLFTWDGTATTYNQIVDVSGGSPESIQSHNNYPHFFVNGSLCAWAGGKDITKIRTLANSDTTYKNVVDLTRCYPNMMTIRDSLLHLGYPSSTTNVTTEHGVYVWGSIEKNYPSTFNYGYTISTGTNLNTAGTLQLGCVRSFGDEMYLSWKDGANFGLDIVDSFCKPAPIAKFRTRRFDSGIAYNDKQALRISLQTSAIPTGCTVSTLYKINNDPIVTQAAMTTGTTGITNSVQKGAFKRIITGFDITCTGAVTTSPIIYAETLQFNPLIDRKAI